MVMKVSLTLLLCIIIVINSWMNKNTIIMLCWRKTEVTSSYINRTLIAVQVKYAMHWRFCVQKLILYFIIAAWLLQFFFLTAHLHENFPPATHSKTCTQYPLKINFRQSEWLLPPRKWWHQSKKSTGPKSLGVRKKYIH